MKLSLLLHAHQPPGNYDSVFQRGIDQCYGPVLDEIEAHPGIRLSLHWSGPLLEWMEEHTPDRIEQIRRLVERGQVELVAAGMYEPVLALLPRADRVPQIRTHRAYLQRLFGVDTNVGWLTERVWDQSIAAELVDGGIETVTLDDRHLLSAGLQPDQLDAPYLTESEGKSLLIAPVAEPLRMAVPWDPVERVVDLLSRAAASGSRMMVYADDIEKFGMWPGTFRSVIQRRWLARFFDALERLDTVEVVPVGEAAAAVPPAGRAYLPDGSYPEMLEWSLPPAGQRAFARARETLQQHSLFDQVSPFMRAGQYLQFLAKYPEVNHLHKRMHDVSARAASLRRGLRAYDPDDVPPALLDLWRAQANCAYWHGLFGGAYLPHIRQRLWHHLLRAERALDEQRSPRVLRRVDLDADRTEEVIVTTDALLVVADPGEGALIEVSDRTRGINLVDTLARREEAYHGTDGDAPYVYDRGRRGWFVDRFLAPGRAPARRGDVVDLGEFEGQPYAVRARQSPENVAITLERDGTAPGGTARVAKTVRIGKGDGRISAAYRVEATAGEVDARFGIELNLGLAFAEQPGGTVHTGDSTFNLPRGGAARGVEGVSVAVDEIDVALDVRLSIAADVDVRPIETVSRSEGGFERTIQQWAILCHWPVRLRPGDVFEVDVHVDPLARGAGR